MYRYLKGSIPRANVAEAIVKATYGEVTFKDLGLSEAMIARIKLRRRNKRKRKQEKE